MRHDVIEDIVATHIPPGTYAEQWDAEGLENDVLRVLGLDIPVNDWVKEEGIADEEIMDRLTDASDKKMAEKAANAGLDLWRRVEKSIVLQILDQHWKEHLLALDHIRQGINLRAFGQKDPLNEYKAEAFGLFENMLDQMRENIVLTLCLVEINFEEDRKSLYMPGMMPDESEMQETRKDPATNTEEEAKQQPVTSKKIPRNAPCPCGSGKKYKQCHGKLQATA